jgi:hypothetical protein
MTVLAGCYETDRREKKPLWEFDKTLMRMSVDNDEKEEWDTTEVSVSTKALPSGKNEVSATSSTIPYSILPVPTKRATALNMSWL